MRDTETYRGRIDEVIVIGGSSRIPKLREELSDFFNGITISRPFNPKETVARGLAFHAAYILGRDYQYSSDLPGFLLIDALPISLGIGDAGGSMTKIFKRNSPIPHEERGTFSTGQDNQAYFPVRIFEGE